MKNWNLSVFITSLVLGCCLCVCMYSSAVWAIESDEQAQPETQLSREADQITDETAQDVLKLEQEINTLKAANISLEEQGKTLEQEITRQSRDLAETREQITLLWGIQSILSPVRLFSPLVANLAYIFGATALLILVLVKPVVARKVLSFKFLSGLPVRKSSDSEVSPLGYGARWFWAILVLFLLLLLATPAVSQESMMASPDAATQGVPADASDNTQPSQPPAAVSESPAESNASAAVAVPAGATGAATLESQLDKASELIELTPLQRSILVLEELKEGESAYLNLDIPLVADIQKAAKAKEHPCILDAKDPPEEAVTLTLRKGSLSYYFVLASLYEAAGREEVKNLLEQGSLPLVADSGAALSQLDSGALDVIMHFLAAYRLVEPVRLMIPVAVTKADSLDQVRSILDVAHRLDLGAEYKSALEQLVANRQGIDIVEGLARLALEHGRKELALIPIEAALVAPYGSLEDNLKVVALLAEVADATRVDQELGRLCEGASFAGLLKIAETASALKSPARLKEALEKAAGSPTIDYAQLLAKAAELHETAVVVSFVAQRLKDRPSDAQRLFESTFPKESGIPSYEKEKTSLGAVIAAYVFAEVDRNDPQVRELLESVSRAQLDAIIASHGADNLMLLNDLFALVHYYRETNNPGLDAATRMLTLQRRLRGLSDGPVEDVRQLALQMELDGLRAENRDVSAQVSGLRQQAEGVAAELAEVTHRRFLLLAELGAKFLLLLIGLWIALTRGVAAAKLVTDFRFSHFCFTFAETIGFELCCTIVFLPAGTVLTLVCQDRLKHQRIMEMPGFWNELQEACSTPTACPAAPESTSKCESQGLEG